LTPRPSCGDYCSTRHFEHIKFHFAWQARRFVAIRREVPRKPLIASFAVPWRLLQSLSF
jgi:hypothetical protein